MIHGEGEVLVPAHLNFGKFILDRLRRAKPGLTCLRNCTSGEQLTYSELTQYVVRLAAALKQLGVGRGDTVAVGGESRATFLPTGVAVMLTGAAHTPIPLGSGSAILTHKLNLTKPKYVICTRLFWEKYSEILKSSAFIDTFICFDDIEEIELSVESMMSSQNDVDVESFEPAYVRGDDVALILYSSGTTGMSKGVLITHLNCIVRCNTKMYGFDFLRVAYIPGIHHAGSYATFVMYSFLCAGKTVVYSENDMDMKIIQDYGVDLMATVPVFAEEVLDADQAQFDLSSLKVIYTAASPLHLAVAQAFKGKYPEIKLLNLYGSTEAQIMTASYPCEGATTSVGVAVPGISIKVVDKETRAILGPNQRGEVCVRGPSLMKGYLAATSPYMDEEGFYLTGDLGYYDENKQFYLESRLNDIMNCDLGFKVSPVELEGILMTHPAVREAAVVGVQEKAGERPAAFVVLRPGLSATAAELQDHVAKQVPWYMQLRGGVRFISELPRNELQKVLRNQLKEKLALE